MPKKAVLSKTAFNWLAFLLPIQKVQGSVLYHPGLGVLDLPQLLQAVDIHLPFLMNSILLSQITVI